jgi:hypothetical protein
MFLASKEDWISGLETLLNIESKSRVAISDDTALIRNFVSKSDIWIDKSFSADYAPRTKFSAFLKNARYRGQTFVDSYWESKTIFGRLVKFLPTALLLFPVIFVSFGVIALLISTLAALTAIELIFFVYSFKQWRKMFRAFSETVVLFPMMINFGFGYLKAYAFRLLTRSSS